MTPQAAIPALRTLCDEVVRTGETRTFLLRGVQAILAKVDANDEEHVHRYKLEPSGRGIGFDYECACGRIKNPRPII